MSSSMYCPEPQVIGWYFLYFIIIIKLVYKIQLRNLVFVGTYKQEVQYWKLYRWDWGAHGAAACAYITLGSTHLNLLRDLLLTINNMNKIDE